MSTPEVAAACCGLPAPELSLYRDQCLALLQRYFLMSVEAGRLPALLGREVFRARARSYRLISFEDIIIFVHDVESCLRRLPAFDRELISRIVFQQYTQEECAALLGVCERTVRRRFPEVLDALTDMFLVANMLHTGTRHYRHLPPELAQPPATFDLQAYAAGVENAGVTASVVLVGALGKNLSSPSFSGFARNTML
jgi:hypothetical protein